MIDKALLELAAKAAGLTYMDFCWDGYGRGRMVHRWTGLRWNPLTDDGDALRLAVKCQIDIEFFVDEHGTTSAVQVEYCDYRCNIGRDEVEPMGNIGAATRLAIVRAAAEKGKWLG